MDSLWLVARREYRRVVSRRSFLILSLAVPVAMVALIAAVILITSSGESKLPLGYVDQSGLLDIARQAELPQSGAQIAIQEFPDVTSASAALQSKAVQAYFVIPDGYPQSLKTELYYLSKPPSREAWDRFDDFMRLNLAASFPPDVAARLVQGPQIAVYDIASGREFSQAGIVNIILPFAASFFFILTTMSASGYMLEVVSDEKENRMMEVLLTSLTPAQLMGGKALGLLAVALTQMALFVLAVLAGLLLARSGVPELSQLQVPWAYLGVVALFFFPTFALISAIMVTVGASTTELQQGQQAAGLLNMLFLSPLFLLVLLFENPASPLMVGLTLFPPTAFMTVSLRWGLGTIPLWQLATSWLLLVASTLGMVWASGRVFQVGMLRYGQPLSLKTVLAALRSA